MASSSSEKAPHLRQRKRRTSIFSDEDVSGNGDQLHDAADQRVDDRAMATRASSSYSPLRKVDGNTSVMSSSDPVITFAAESSRFTSSEAGTSDSRSDIPPPPAHTTSKNRTGTTSLIGKQIFLSHSSEQGSFVEQLNENLRNEGYLPFFHKDPASLPKGEKFPDRIFQFARECEVAVVELSEKYLLSKWPMLELATFFGAQKTKILPLFFKLEVSALKVAKMRERVVRAWEAFAKDDARIDPNKWGEVVRALWSINGEAFDGVSSEVA